MNIGDKSGHYLVTDSSNALRKVLCRLRLVSQHDPHTGVTPERLLRYLEHWADWPEKPPFTVTTFPNLVPTVDQMITVTSIPFWSCCSHHLLPFHGEVTVGYIPDEYIIGLSKVSMVVRWIARKPQVQEHLAHEIADYFETILEPMGLGVYIRAWHTCQMLDVGPEAPQMVVTELRGVMKHHAAKMEFLREVKE